MIQFVIPAIIVLVAAIIILVIIIRHFPQAASIDVEALPAEQEAAMKAAMMEKRLKRKILETKNKAVPVFRRLGKAFVGVWERLHARVEQMEQRYRPKPHTMTSEKQQDIKPKIRQLLEEAEGLVKEEKFSDAEKKYIEALSWDHKNLDAFLGLGEVYYEQKSFKQAKETYMHLLKLITAQEAGEEQVSPFSRELTDVQVNEVYFDYAISMQLQGDLDGAVEQLKILTERDEKNPKYLDKLVDLSILIKDRSTAFRTLDKLKEVNPENNKISEFEEKIKQLPF